MIRASAIPNYRWPEAWLSRRYAPWRALAAGVFHAGRLAGKIASIINLGRRAVAVLRTDGAGDAILSDPMLRSLARHFDDCEIDLWAPEGTVALLQAHLSVSRLITVPRGFKDGNLRFFWSLSWRLKMGWQLGRSSYAVAVYLPDDPEPLGSWLLENINATEKWVNPGSTLNQFDWQRAEAVKAATRVLKPRPKGGHALQRNAFLASQWDSSIDKDRPDVPLSARALTYASVEVGAARHAVRRARASGLIGLVPAGSAQINQFPAEKWAEVIKRLWHEHRLMGAFLSTPADEPIIHKITQNLPDVPFYRFPVDQDIAVAAAVVSRLDGLISVDTGLAHAAVAFDLPTVTLVTGGMPGRFWPWPIPTRSVALTKPVACGGCNYRCTQDLPHCIVDLRPEQVVDALLETMTTQRIMPRHKDATEYRHAV